MCHFYVNLNATEAQRTQEELFTPSLTTEKNLDGGLGLGRELSPEITTKNIG